MAALMATPTPVHRLGGLVLAAGAVVEIDHRGASKWHVVVERLALHGVLEAVDAGLDDAVDLVGGPVVEWRHQAELGQHLGEIAPCAP